MYNEANKPLTFPLFSFTHSESLVLTDLMLSDSMRGIIGQLLGHNNTHVTWHIYSHLQQITLGEHNIILPVTRRKQM